MTGARRLAALAARASGRQPRLAFQCGQVRQFAAMPATSNEDDYKRMQSVKEKAHITVRAAPWVQLQRCGSWSPGSPGATLLALSAPPTQLTPLFLSRPVAGGVQQAASVRGPRDGACTAAGGTPHRRPRVLPDWWRHGTGGHHRAREEPPVEGECPLQESCRSRRCLRGDTPLLRRLRESVGMSPLTLASSCFSRAGPGAHPVRKLRVCVRNGGPRLRHGAWALSRVCAAHVCSPTSSPGRLSHCWPHLPGSSRLDRQTSTARATLVHVTMAATSSSTWLSGAPEPRTSRKSITP